jgi:hypothetical protein
MVMVLVMVRVVMGSGGDGCRVVPLPPQPRTPLTPIDVTDEISGPIASVAAAGASVLGTVPP